MLLAAGLASGGGAEAGGTPGQFDYWVLSLSWIPEFCKIEPGDSQCKYPSNGFYVHGLWPQYERGYPAYCAPREQVPEDMVLRLQPIMPTRELIQYEWNKHGSCSGLSQEEYFMQLERARRAIAIPEQYQAPEQYQVDSAFNIKQAFLAVNPSFDDQSLVLQCHGKFLREVRVCFNADLEPRACGRDVEDKCRDKITIRPGRNIE
ncbi:ribonuclease T2 [Solimonas aquatica]|uniref:Ribonuclease T2 n=1 Tax=Solimonas aquatica TaxID=489703 RepID=A0A1H8ZIW1_9GAMM|nr:ribonuclease T(2) [Solimonas aquatica]SEP64380.1 ribonuclease T2 [Solimonas aquatica]